MTTRPNIQRRRFRLQALSCLEIMLSGGGPNQPPMGEINPAKKSMQVENSLTNKPTQIAHRGLFAKEFSTLEGSSSGWVDFAHRWLVLIRPVTIMQFETIRSTPEMRTPGLADTGQFPRPGVRIEDKLKEIRRATFR